MNRPKDETQRLNNISKWYSSRKGLDSKLIQYRAKILLPHFKGSRALELRCADGRMMTQLLINYFEKIVAVDGPAKFCEITRNRINANNLDVVCLLFEEFEPNKKFDTIIMAHILEHVEDSVSMLRKAKSWLKENGIILIDVPNANSIHRQVGVKMGLLKRVDELNELDKKLGHRRVYTWETLQEDVEEAGLNIKERGGIFENPHQFTNRKMLDRRDDGRFL